MTPHERRPIARNPLTWRKDRASIPESMFPNVSTGGDGSISFEWVHAGVDVLVTAERDGLSVSVIRDGELKVDYNHTEHHVAMESGE